MIRQNENRGVASATDSFDWAKINSIPEYKNADVKLKMSSERALNFVRRLSISI